MKKTTDAATKKEVVIAPNGYDATKDDDVHKCDDAKPNVGGIDIKKAGGAYQVIVSVTQGANSLTGLEIRVNGATVNSQSVSSSGDYTATVSLNAGDKISAVITDNAFYTAEMTREVTGTE